MGTHKKYGGSKIELTELCPGSVKAQADMGDMPAGPAAQRGTRIHSRVEELWADPTFKAATAHDEEAIAQEVYKALLQVAADHGFEKHEVKIEEQFTLHMISTEAGGTADAIAWRAFGDMIVPDIKTGRNYVSPDGNLQLMFYAIGALQSIDDFTRGTLGMLHLLILQPEQEPPYYVHVRKWSIPVAEVPRYEDRFRDIINRAETNPDLRLAGDHCEGKYCNARTTCPAYTQFLSQKSDGQFQRLLEGEKIEITHGAQIAKLLELKPYATKLFAAAEEQAQALLIANPESVPDWKLVNNYGNRVFTDEKAVEAKCKEIGLKPSEIKPPKFISVAQLEKLFKVKKIEIDLSEFVEKPFIGQKLAQKKEVDTALAALISTASQ